MTDFREPIGIPQRGEPPTPRVGVAPFGEGEIAIRGKDTVDIGFERIDSRKIPAGGLGSVFIQLERPIAEDTIDDYIQHTVSTENAAAINEAGEIILGKSADFVRQGYYALGIRTYMPVGSPHYHEQNMKVNLWVDERPDALQTDLSDFREIGLGLDIEYNWEKINGDERKYVGSLFTNGKENLLRRLRINFEARMQSPKGVTR